jgi:hypothetical protein
MKVALILTLLILSSCTSNKIQHEIPPFYAEKVCSNKSMAYFKHKKNESTVVLTHNLREAMRSRLLVLEPGVEQCYTEEVARTKKPHAFNLCFIAGYSKKGKLEYFNFSTKEIELTKEFQVCLAGLKRKKELQGFKNFSVLQPFLLYPKQ